MAIKSRDWNPQSYLAFGAERTRPAADLVMRIGLETPGRILDLGCGPGNSTRLLADRWPESRITALDHSAAMIERARADWPGGERPRVEWIRADAAGYETAERFDLVFSNAVIQWIPDHERLLDRFLALLNPGGALAVQAPLFRDMPMSAAIDRAASRPSWKKTMAGAGDVFTYHEAAFYYDRLAPRAAALDLWATDYIHVLDRRPALVEWIKATGLRPYLERLREEDERRAFERDFLEELEEDYPERPDGTVLFPFKRLFFVAYTSP
ncbi:MAG: methyltransferase domain-containing protein [Spirochaetales bacterium]|nr:methyltransferase domain-containing protein [Spirochaetales bacterium]